MAIKAKQSAPAQQSTSYSNTKRRGAPACIDSRGVERYEDGMRVEYNLPKAVRGRYAGMFSSKMVRAVVLDEDVAKAYPTSKSVNRALRAYQKLQSEKLLRRRKAG